MFLTLRLRDQKVSDRRFRHISKPKCIIRSQIRGVRIFDRRTFADNAAYQAHHKMAQIAEAGIQDGRQGCRLEEGHSLSEGEDIHAKT